jgi:hypothetical protein
MADEFRGRAAPLDRTGLEDASGFLGIDAAAIWTVLAVETSGVGFLADRRPKILFERHIFSRETGHRYDLDHPGISNPRAGGYGQAGAGQYDRLMEAMALDHVAAMASASWGIGQIMGFNFEAAGFSCIGDMVAAMKESENGQLMAMANFLASNKLDLPLKRLDWATFARGYNGPDYAKNRYDSKLSDAYGKYASGALPDLDVRAAQLFLLYLGFDPGPVDGALGRRTRAALSAFLSEKGRSPSDTVTEDVLDLLGRCVAQA